MKKCIFLGTRLEALKIVGSYFKIDLIVTTKKSFIDKYFKKKIKKLIINRTNKSKLFKLISQKKTDLLFSAGFPYLIPKYVLKKKKYKFNSHPSLLPKFKGLKPIDDIYKKKIKKFGVTIHEIDEKIDSGQILDQNYKIYKTRNLNRIKKSIFSNLEPKLINKFIKKIYYEI